MEIKHAPRCSGRHSGPACGLGCTVDGAIFSLEYPPGFRRPSEDEPWVIGADTGRHNEPSYSIRGATSAIKKPEPWAVSVDFIHFSEAPGAFTQCEMCGGGGGGCWNCHVSEGV